MKTLLIANRGEIAIRIARTAEEMGLKVVMVAPRDDAEARHTRYGDAVQTLSGAGPKAYLSSEGLLEAARCAGADAVHPGYGFLSESADFAAAVRAAGLTFVGPSAETLSLLGDKSRSRDLAASSSVPTPKGLAGPITLADAQAFMKAQSGAPAVMIKAVSGGGGRGARPVRAVEDLPQVMEICAAEANAAFGDDRLYLEELIQSARHIEIQIVRDSAGQARHLFERECSLQRNRQKVLELAPSPSISEALREKLYAASIALAHASELTGLATFEYLVRPDESFVFIEANPRLQVEHTVTEAVTGLDLVRLQLQVAQGAELQDCVAASDWPQQPRGFAAQVRINGERVGADGAVLPATGSVTSLVMPDGPGIRIDSAAHPGFRPNPAYDSLLAKLIIHAGSGSFETLVSRIRRALADTVIDGLDTNLSLLRALVARDDFTANAVDTEYLDRALPDLVGEAQARKDHGERTGDAEEAPDGPVDVTLADGEFALRAPFAGVVAERLLEVGGTAAAGATVLLLEAMKMQHDVAPEVPGTLKDWRAEVGQPVREGYVLAIFESADLDADTSEVEARLDPDHIPPSLEALEERRALLSDDARPVARDKLYARGRRTVRENVADLVDPGSFHEIGDLMVAARRKTTSLADLLKQTPADGLVAGFASINSAEVEFEQSECAVVAYDYSVFAGTQGVMNHKKKDRIFELIYRAERPLVLFGGGGGGRPGDTDLRIGLDIPTFHTFARLKGRVPIIAIVSGPCFAGNAALAGCADVLIATEDASIGMGGPAMIEGGGLGRVATKDVGPVSVQAANGLIDLVVKDEADAVAAAKACLRIFQGAVEPVAAADQRNLRHIIPEARARAFPVRRVIEGLADTGSVIEVKREFGAAMITAFARFEGRPVGVLANNNVVLAGAIDADAAAKADEFLKLCETYRLPVLSLCDTPGFMVGPDVERQGQVKKSCGLFATGANLTVPFLCVVLRKAYGLGAQAMAGGSFHAPDLAVTWPSGEFGAMGFEGAVRLGYRKQLESIEDDAERQAFFEARLAELYDDNKALTVAEYLEIDTVIDPAETRDWILHGLRRRIA